MKTIGFRIMLIVASTLVMGCASNEPPTTSNDTVDNAVPYSYEKGRVFETGTNTIPALSPEEIEKMKKAYPNQRTEPATGPSSE